MFRDQIPAVLFYFAILHFDLGIFSFPLLGIVKTACEPARAFVASSERGRWECQERNTSCRDGYTAWNTDEGDPIKSKVPRLDDKLSRGDFKSDTVRLFSQSYSIVDPNENFGIINHSTIKLVIVIGPSGVQFRE